MLWVLWLIYYKILSLVFKILLGVSMYSSILNSVLLEDINHNIQDIVICSSWKEK